MFLFRKLRLIFLYSQFKRLRSELIYQNAGRDTVQDAEEDGHSAENHGGHPDLHHKKAYEIRDDRHYAVCSALNLRACVIRLQQIVNRQIMHRKENAQAEFTGFSVPPEAYSSPARPPPITAAGSRLTLTISRRRI